MPFDDGTLIARLRTGDDVAFEELVEHHAAPLLAVTRRILRDEEEARDAVQETFVAAFRGIGDFQAESRVSTWLHRIAVNCALMKLRVRERRREQDVDALAAAFDADGHQVHSSVGWSESAEDILQREQACALVRAMHRSTAGVVPRRPRAARYRAAPGGRRRGEARDQPRHLKVKLHRARQALRTLLDPHMRGVM